MVCEIFVLFAYAIIHAVLADPSLCEINRILRLFSNLIKQVFKLGCDRRDPPRGEQGKMHLLLGNMEHKITLFRFFGEQANLFQWNKGAGTPIGGPYRLHLSNTGQMLKIQ